MPLAASLIPPAFPCSFGEEPPEENRVHLGHAIMSFYAALIDLLGRCAPEMHVRPKGRDGGCVCMANLARQSGIQQHCLSSHYVGGPGLGSAEDKPGTKKAPGPALPELPVQGGGGN